MSLVREALAKAEREAAARAAREKGLPPALADAAQPYRARRRPRAPWIAGLTLAALGGAGAAFVLLRSAASSTPPVARASAPAPAPVAAASDAAENAELAGLLATPAAAPASAPPATAAETHAGRAANDESAATAAPATPPVAAPAPAVAATPAAAPPPATVGQPAPAALAGSFVREYALGDGRSIRLGGIAWSEAAPLAYLNGRLRGVGELVEGWRVAAIERERVVLEQARVRVAVSLR